MARKFFSCLALLALATFAPACEQDGGEPSSEYVDGQEAVTDDGAFTVTLFHHDGAPIVGDNVFYIRVAVVDPADPEDEGRGVPNLELALAAEMSNENHAMQTEPTFAYEGDGTYRIEGVYLDRAGSWNLDFDLEFGSIQEDVTFGFMLEG